MLNISNIYGIQDLWEHIVAYTYLGYVGTYISRIINHFTETLCDIDD